MYRYTPRRCAPWMDTPDYLRNGYTVLSMSLLYTERTECTNVCTTRPEVTSYLLHSQLRSSPGIYTRVYLRRASSLLDNHLHVTSHKFTNIIQIIDIVFDVASYLLLLLLQTNNCIDWLHFYCAMLLHWAGISIHSMMSVRLSVRPSGVTLMDCDHISWAAWNFITLSLW